ncbi:MAG: hypothetical protein Q8M57_00200, partial [Nitrosomonas sp.]|uniref:hypothetical protein n=1 Tax=Nitrosomonas sp. TaxID=42353 RepID=UPI002733DBC9
NNNLRIVNLPPAEPEAYRTSPSKGLSVRAVGCNSGLPRITYYPTGSFHGAQYSYRLDRWSQVQNHEF